MTAAETRRHSAITISLTLIVDLPATALYISYYLEGRVPALPAGVTSNQFSWYVATHRDVQTAADITDGAVQCALAGRPARVAGDAEVSGDANGSEMAQETDNDANEPPPFPSRCTWSWRQQLAVSPMSVHAAGLATLKSMLRI